MTPKSLYMCRKATIFPGLRPWTPLKGLQRLQPPPQVKGNLYRALKVLHLFHVKTNFLLDISMNEF